MTDRTEAYYVAMEAACNEASDTYFKARPHLIRASNQEKLFEAGFQRAFALLWERSQVSDVAVLAVTQDGQP